MTDKPRCNIDDKFDAFIGVRVPRCVKDHYDEYCRKHHITNNSELYRAALTEFIYKLLGWD